MEKLSIIDAEQKIDLENNKSDKTVIALKTILEIIPLGSLFSEIITNVIPNQRMERVVLFIEILNEKLKYIERDVIEQKTKTEEFTDLLQDGMQQASRALSKERLEYIASILKNSLTDEELEHLEKKELLSILNELNDAEIIWLKSFSEDISDYSEFYEAHKTVLERPDTMIGSGGFSQTKFDKKAFQESYINKLFRLRLIKDESGKSNTWISQDTLSVSDFDHNLYSSTDLGNLFLKFIYTKLPESG